MSDYFCQSHKIFPFSRRLGILGFYLIFNCAPAAFAEVTTSQVPCQQRYSHSESACYASSLWRDSTFTKPENIPKQAVFKFVFTVIQDRYAVNDVVGDNEWGYKLLINPDLFEENPKISASLISEKHNTAFFNPAYGFILSIDPQNVVATNKVDLGSGIPSQYAHNVEPWLQQISYQYPIKTPDSILEESTPAAWNEVVLIGKNQISNTKVKAIGLVINCPQSNRSDLGSAQVPSDKIDITAWPQDKFQGFVSQCFSGRFQNVIPLIERLRSRMPVIVMQLHAFY